MRPRPAGSQREQGEEIVRQNQYMEGVVLGNILNTENIPPSAEKLSPADFFNPDHQKLFACMLSLHRRGESTGEVTLYEELTRTYGDGRERDLLIAHVPGLTKGLPSINQAGEAARVVKTDSALRQIAAVFDDERKQVWRFGCNPLAVAERVREKLTSIEESVRAPDTGSALKIWENIPDVASLTQVQYEYLVPGLIPKAAVVLVTGLPGTHKTNLEMSIGWAVSEGGFFLGRQCSKAPVLVLDRENPQAVIQERMHLLKITPSALFKWWGLWSDEPPLLSDPRLLAIARDLKPLIFFDTLIRFIGDCDENDASEIKIQMEFARRLASAGATPILLHHAPWSWANDGNKFFRGSVDILGASDLGYSLAADGHDDRELTLAVEKTRYGEKFTLKLRTPDFRSGVGFELASSPANSPVDAIVEWVQQQGGESTREKIKRRKGYRRSSSIMVLNQALQQGRLVEGKRGMISVPVSGTDHFSFSAPQTGTDGNGQ
jgi:hypothetical protein